MRGIIFVRQKGRHRRGSAPMFINRHASAHNGEAATYCYNASPRERGFVLAVRSRSGKLPSTPKPISSTLFKNHELLPLGKARKRPKNCLPRTSGALIYTHAGGHHEKESGPSLDGH